MNDHYELMYGAKYELFDDLINLDEITTAAQITELLGDPIVLDRYRNKFDYLVNRTVAIAELCWGNKDENGEKLQKTMIRMKRFVEDDESEIRVLPLNRFMFCLSMIRPIVAYQEDINLDDFILSSYLTARRIH